MKNLAFHSLPRLEDDYTIHSHYIAYAFSLWEVGRMYFLILGVKRLNTLTLSLPSSKTTTFSQPFKEKRISEVVRIGSIVIFYLSKLWKPKFSILCDVTFLMRLQEKFEIDHAHQPAFSSWGRRSWAWVSCSRCWVVRRCSPRCAVVSLCAWVCHFPTGTAASWSVSPFSNRRSPP